GVCRRARGPVRPARAGLAGDPGAAPAAPAAARGGPAGVAVVADRLPGHDVAHQPLVADPEPAADLAAGRRPDQPGVVGGGAAPRRHHPRRGHLGGPGRRPGHPEFLRRQRQAAHPVPQLPHQRADGLLLPAVLRDGPDADADRDPEAPPLRRRRALPLGMRPPAGPGSAGEKSANYPLQSIRILLLVGTEQVTLARTNEAGEPLRSKAEWATVLGPPL